MNLSKSIKIKIINNLPQNAVKEIAVDIDKSVRWVQKVLYEDETDNYNIWEKAAIKIKKAKEALRKREEELEKILAD